MIRIQFFEFHVQWEWCVGDINKPSDPNNASNWHMYDMEVQAVIEESWTKGEQTIDIGKHFPGCPYIINFCNMTQVRSKTGQVRRVRRLPQPSYPMVRLTQAEIAAMLHRKGVYIEFSSGLLLRRVILLGFNIISLIEISINPLCRRENP